MVSGKITSPKVRNYDFFGIFFHLKGLVDSERPSKNIISNVKPESVTFDFFRFSFSKIDFWWFYEIRSLDFLGFLRIARIFLRKSRDRISQNHKKSIFENENRKKSNVTDSGFTLQMMFFEGLSESTSPFRWNKFPKKIIFSKNEIGKQAKSIENQAKCVISVHWSRIHATGAHQWPAKYKGWTGSRLGVTVPWVQQVGILQGGWLAEWRWFLIDWWFVFVDFSIDFQCFLLVLETFSGRESMDIGQKTMDFDEKPQLWQAVAPSSGSLSECRDMFLKRLLIFVSQNATKSW